MKKYKDIPELLSDYEFSDKFAVSGDVWQTVLDRINDSSSCLSASKGVRFKYRLLVAGSIAALVLVGIVSYFTLQFPVSNNDAVAAISSIEKGMIKSGGIDFGNNISVKVKQELVSSEGTVAALRLGFGSVKIMGYNQFKFVAKNILEVAIGEMEIEINEKRPDGFFVKTPFASVKVTGTKFYIKVASETTLLEVTEGVVEFGNENGTVEVTAGFQTLAGLNRAPLQPIPKNILTLNKLSGNDKNVCNPVIMIIPDKITYTAGDDLKLKIQVLNRNKDMWFTSFAADTSYLLLNVTAPNGKVFYSRLNILKDSIGEPCGLQSRNGWFTFPKDSPYAFECQGGNIFTLPGKYVLRVIYGAAAPNTAEVSKMKIWQGVIESAPLAFEVKEKN